MVKAINFRTIKQSLFTSVCFYSPTFTELYGGGGGGGGHFLCMLYYIQEVIT